MRKTFLLLLSMSLFGIGCGGGKSSLQVPDSGVTVSVSSSASTLLVRAPAKITASVSGTSDTRVTFSVVEAGGGQVAANGDYVAPQSTGTFHVRATSVAAPDRFAETTITVHDYAKLVARAPNMTDARDHHTASLLADGSVLVVGGQGFTGVHSRSERYVPNLAQFQTAATLARARIQHAAAVLPSGKVIVSGGYNPLTGGTPFDEAYRSSEIYDAATDQFTAGPEMTFPRRQHELTLLKDGRVLVTGGIQLIGYGFGASPNLEIYDPNANAFASVGRLIEGRWQHTATLLNDGRVLIVGGRSNNCLNTCPMFSLATAEIFDPRTGMVTPTGSLSLARHAHSATLLGDGRVLVLGGESYGLPDTDQVATGEVYDPATGTWQNFGSLQGGRSHFTMTLLNNGKYLVAGGKNWNGTIVGSTEIFDPVTGSSEIGPEMNDWRIRHTATRLSNGEVLIVGGNNSGGAVLPVDLFR